MGSDDKIIVFLDDDTARAAKAFQRMNDKDKARTFWVSTVPETLDMLENYRERLDIVSLDHDLGGNTFVNTARDDCGTEVVRWLEKKDAKDYAHVRFIIHSWNHTAATKMAYRLYVAGYRVMVCPFGMSA